MKVIVGLGNPGPKYEHTRHNVGFAVLTAFAEQNGQPTTKEKFHALAAEITIGGQRVLLIQPQTFMNLSGKSVLAARDFYQVESSDILVVCDDFSLPLGKLRFRKKGSAGGQKGLGDIINRLGGNEIPRLRVGIDPPPPRWDVADYVLSKFKKSEEAVIGDAIQKSAGALYDWATKDIDYCMNQYNPD